MEDITRLEDGRAVVHKRGGGYHVRICIGPNQYVTRSLRTGNRAVALKAGLRLYHQLTAKLELGLPLASRTVNAIIDEYVAYRTTLHHQGHTSEGMLRQVIRVLRFWREFAGDKPITTIDNAVLREFVPWRRDYHRRRQHSHHNAKRDPSDKEIVYNVTIMRAVLRWAHEHGELGTLPLPTYVFTAKNKRVRPAFELPEYRRLWRALMLWERDCAVSEHLHTRQLLRDYVMILAGSGMRVGEANNLRNRDVQRFVDRLGRRNHRLIVRGKTGERDVIPRAYTVRWIDRVMARKSDPRPDDWFFAMRSGGRIISLIDQLDKVLKLAEIERNAVGDKFSLYSLRHFYAVMALRGGLGVFDIARNMGTSVQMIQQYYGKQATPLSMATALGGGPRAARVVSTRRS